MSAPERLRQRLDLQQERLRASVPPHREAALLAVLRAQDRLLSAPADLPRPDLIAGYRIGNLGGSKALQFCLEATDAAEGGLKEDLDAWASRFLQDCAALAEVGLVLGHVETGFMRIVDDGHDAFDAWIASKHLPATWREQADIDWWAAFLTRHHEDANDSLDAMAWQLGYPPDASIDGCPVQTYRDVLAWLIRQASEMHDQVPRPRHALIAAIAADLNVDPSLIARAVDALTLDREGAEWHAAVPGVAAAPLVQISPDHLASSRYGLGAEPLLFLARELRRRNPEDYHNAAYLRENVFRLDLYAVFGDKRFVTSTGRIELRREAGTIRTDIDAAVFDRKTGTLGLFELKSQDPFARSTAELARRRDNVLYANRQVSALLDWLNRNDANELLNRVDSRTARNFRVQKVLPFVLGRTLVHFDDGPAPDRRAAWGTWPELLRLLDGQPARTANPLVSLFSRLGRDVPQLPASPGQPARALAIGPDLLTVYPSYSSYQSRGSFRPPG